MAAEEEAAELWSAAAGDADRLEKLVVRRTAGEPLAWVTGSTVFCGIRLRVDHGVYVPRWQTEALALRAAALLPPSGQALDLCTGTGALAAVLTDRVPGAVVVATDVSPVAVACARANGVDARLGSLDDPVPADWEGAVDVVVSVVPYVPTGSLHLLDRDSRENEPLAALDGGPAGTRWLKEVVVRAPRWLRPGSGRLLLELGEGQLELLRPALRRAGLSVVGELRDDDGDLRGIETG